jgi:hypothetical protein
MKVARTVLSGGKGGDNIKALPIATDFFLVHNEDIDHYFEIPDEDEIDVRVHLVW